MILGQKAKSNHYGDSNEPPVINKNSFQSTFGKIKDFLKSVQRDKSA